MCLMTHLIIAMVTVGTLIACHSGNYFCDVNSFVPNYDARFEI